MQSTAKANALVRDLADKLRIRLVPGSAGLNSVRLAFDAQGWPMIFCSHNANEAEAQPVVLLRIRNPDMQSKDVFGGSTFAYAPHILELAYELASSNNPEASLADIEVIKYEAQKLGCRYQEKAIANGSAVNEANLNAAAPIADLEDLYWPTKSV
jgi:hypothetical protein